MGSYTIEHHPERSCFSIPLTGTPKGAAGNSEALLQYRLTEGEPGSINFTYTFVPPELRGQGVAESLVRHGLSWAREQNYDIRASCWYVAKFLR